MVLLIVALCFVMRCYHRESYDSPVQGRMRSLVLDRLSYLVGVRKKNVYHGDVASPPSASASDLDVQACGEEEKEEKLGFLVKKILDKEEEDTIKQEWRIVGLTLDRCFCAIFFVILIVLTLSCFLIIPAFDDWVKV